MKELKKERGYLTKYPFSFKMHIERITFYVERIKREAFDIFQALGGYSQ